MNLEEFKCVTRNSYAETKPILIATVDGGPDENPRYAKTLSAWSLAFKKYDFDCIFVACYAPGLSAYKRVERRRPFFSKQLAGRILPHDYYGSHLDGSLRTADEELEKLNFAKAGRLLATIFGECVIDGYPVVSEFVAFDTEKPDVSELPSPKWCTDHVRQSQYFLQIVKCTDASCCKPWKSNYLCQFPCRFLPGPISYAKSAEGLIATPVDALKTNFAPLLLRMSLTYLEPGDFSVMPYDYYCKSVQNVLPKRVCKICKVYYSSVKALKVHTSLHNVSIDESSDDDSDLPSTSNVSAVQETFPVANIFELFVENPFEDVDSDIE